MNPPKIVMLLLARSLRRLSVVFSLGRVPARWPEPWTASSVAQYFG